MGAKNTIPQLAPMPDEELARIKEQVERRWLSKPHYGFDPQGPDEYNSPSCMMRAHEILRMIARVQNEAPAPKGGAA